MVWCGENRKGYRAETTGHGMVRRGRTMEWCGDDGPRYGVVRTGHGMAAVFPRRSRSRSPRPPGPHHTMARPYHTIPWPVLITPCPGPSESRSAGPVFAGLLRRRCRPAGSRGFCRNADGLRSEAQPPEAPPQTPPENLEKLPETPPENPQKIVKIRRENPHRIPLKFRTNLLKRPSAVRPRTMRWAGA